MAKDSKGPPTTVINHLADVHTANGTIDRVLNSGIGSVVAPNVGDTGITSASDAVHGDEPWFFNDTTSKLLADLNPGTAGSYLMGAVPLNGDLYLTYLAGPTEYFSKWDHTTNTVTTLLTITNPEPGYPFNSDAIGSNIYFEQGDGVQAYNVNTGSASNLSIPIAGYVTQTDTYNGELLILGSFTGGVDILKFNPATATWSQYDLIGSPFTSESASYTIGGVGHYYVAADSSNYYVIDLSLPTSSALVSTAAHSANFDVSSSNNDFWTNPMSFGGDFYLQGSNGLLDIDGSDGSITPVLLNGQPIFGLPMENTATAGYFESSAGNAIYRLTENADGTTSVTAFSASLAWNDSAILNGTLYYTGYENGTFGLYELNESTGSGQFVIDLDGASLNGTLEVVASLNGKLIVSIDRDGDGDQQLWTSSNPADASSWTQISPDDVNFSLNYGVLLHGDYLA